MNLPFYLFGLMMLLPSLSPAQTSDTAIMLDTVKITANVIPHTDHHRDKRIVCSRRTKCYSPCFADQIAYGDLMYKVIPYRSQVKMNVRKQEDFEIFFSRTMHEDQVALYIDKVKILQPWDTPQPF